MSPKTENSPDEHLIGAAIFAKYFKQYPMDLDPHPGVTPASDEFRQFAEAHSDPVGLDWGLDTFCKEFPQGIDFALQVYLKASSSDRNANLADVKLSEQYLIPLRHDVGNCATYYKGGSGPEHVGREVLWLTPSGEDTDESCNLYFRKQEVQTDLKAVIERTKCLQELRLSIIVLQAMRGRTHAMGILPSLPGSLRWIGHHLDPFPYNWTKADFIAICVLVRAGGKSLLESIPSDEERQTQLESWKDRFSAFLYTDKPDGQTSAPNKDGDFVIKAHAALVLDNLVRGPWNESSKEIFEPSTWVF
ncbi:hypothetical protein BT63DRAFT_444690 [Microthyrium microscopicum]|uniref:Uncharacterized protein n=1 Tax=Microthyrium microscopicum TaxID=703497 RepID=A0A6A6TW55_9PEZI|nr:hypothetical protein BT63DRAFT_444690 [Microthyrium microscopicum]